MHLLESYKPGPVNEITLAGLVSNLAIGLAVVADIGWLVCGLTFPSPKVCILMIC